MNVPIFEGFGWHVPERSEGRGNREDHALRKASGRATQFYLLSNTHFASFQYVAIGFILTGWTI
jgi:hypothetical protein